MERKRKVDRERLLRNKLKKKKKRKILIFIHSLEGQFLYSCWRPFLSCSTYK